jgi:hypothetical protein
MEKNKMKKAIICTTINSPTEAIVKFSKIPDWDLVIVGDLKTPHNDFEKISCKYLSPTEQHTMYPLLSESLGWNCVQRRNIGFVYAYKNGYDIVATVDDDNIPDDNWGTDIIVGTKSNLDVFVTEDICFDPFSPYLKKELWHRGFPIQLISSKNDIKKAVQESRRVFVQSHLVNGDPDVDAIGRISFAPNINLRESFNFFTSNKIMPFNSQNTIIHRDVLPYYFMFPFIGRMDDIWGAYILQSFFPNCVAFGRANVYQLRNQHDLIKDLEDELLGYRESLNLLKDLRNFKNFLPSKSYDAFKIYQETMFS